MRFCQFIKSEHVACDEAANFEAADSMWKATRILRPRSFSISAALISALVGFLLGIIVFHELREIQFTEMENRFSYTTYAPSLCNRDLGDDINCTRIKKGNELNNTKQRCNVHMNEDRGQKSEDEDGRKKAILSLWENSLYLQNPNLSRADEESSRRNASTLNIMPRPPHLENCRAKVAEFMKWDSLEEGEAGPNWPLWKGLLSQLDPSDRNYTTANDFLQPPWVEGSDADNLPMTRRVQHDLWLHQHPKNCSDPALKFLYVDWEMRRNLGLGAMLTSMAGFLAIALRENRILVANYFSRADHRGCVGSVRGRWHCYFLPETSIQCRKQATFLLSQRHRQNQEAITKYKNYKGNNIWFGEVPGHWGSPWEYMQPTSEVDAKLLVHHLAKDRRWWRAQAVRYLMRFPTEYTCNLMNQARHEAFGGRAADMVLRYLPRKWPKVSQTIIRGEMEKFVWENHKPWVPRPLMSIHVRLGDKASEMQMVGFKGYMDLAYRVRAQFPEVENIWLSTEMQDVINESKTYKDWNFFFTNITRQTGATSMEAYENSLGKEASTSNAIVNFLMATDADFFVGALGSTWCSLIDGMRTTGGKEMAGYLSVNKDRFW